MNLPLLGLQSFQGLDSAAEGSHCPLGEGSLPEPDLRPEAPAIPKCHFQLTAGARPGITRFPVIDVLVGAWIVMEAGHTLGRLRWSNANIRPAVVRRAVDSA